MQRVRSNIGFTLVEMLITMFVASMILLAVTTTFIVQNKTASVQEGVSDLHLNAQVAIDLLERDIRMAGYNQDLPSSLTALNNATASDTDSAVGTDAVFVRYSTSSRANFKYYISKTDQSLTRKNLTTNVAETLANGVEDLQLSYLLDDGTTTTAPNDPTKIRQVGIFILAKSSKKDPTYTTVPPVIGDGIARSADGYRRKVYSTTVSPRNFGLGT